ncbi:hypothetical protein F0562_026605 [Nyssa sinensis]|uniref:C2 NT-type domain-containing protein n=1 Tax=Nyssa sinensis TaxID=561372 RepID=A0A5J5B9U6_9ASTE|nr:hypothetical protein F0562_026605 [Nyssa sinensis]
MFKSARWRSEKQKIKVVFKLQFQATQVPQLRGTTTLMIALVPADVGKPTVRLGKAPVLDGTCSWENPVYETVKLTKELKTGIFSDKVYYFVMSTGSSKAGILGEVSINFTDYIEATKPLTVSLPLRTSDSGAILQVTIQNMQGDVDQRDVEESEAPMAKLQDRRLKTQMRNCNSDGSGTPNFAEDEHFNKIKSQNAEPNGSVRDLQTENTTIPQDRTILRRNSMPQKRTVNAIPTENHVHRRSNTDWSLGSASDGSMADSTNSPEVNLPRDRLQGSSDRSIERLKGEISMLERQVEVLELELQSLRKQVVKESRRGQDLSRQIVGLKEERETLKTECEWLKSSQKNEAEVLNQLQMDSENLRILLEEVRQELNHEKDLNATLRLQLQKTEDSNAELIFAVRDLDEMLEQKNREMSLLSSITKPGQNAEEARENVSKCENDAEEVGLLEQKITEMSGEIEIYRKEREELKMHMNQLAMDYEILKQENHDISSKLEQNQIEQIKMQNDCSEFLATTEELKSRAERLEKEIQKQALELSESSGTINELETQVNGLEKELERQAQGFEEDLEVMGCAKVEQEQRAIRAEEALRKTRWNNANAAEHLQEEFRRISVEMASKLDENEKLAMKAVTEANDLRMQKKVLEEMLQKANKELGLIKYQYEVKLQEICDKTDLKAKQIEQMSLELHEKCMQVEKLKKHEKEMHEALSVETQTLEGKIEGLKMEKNCNLEEAEQKEKLREEAEQTKTTIGEKEMLQRWSKEREDLEREFASVRKEAENLQEESNTLRSLKDEKEAIVGILQSEVQKLTVQYNDLKNSMLEVELEKENLRKQVFKLEGDLEKKAEAITSLKKKQKSDSEQDVEQMTSKDKKSGSLPCDHSREVVFLKEKLNLLKEQIAYSEAALENSTTSPVKEKDIRNKIEEMQTSLEQLDHCRSFSADQFQQEAILPEEATANTTELERTRNRGGNVQQLEINTTGGTSKQNGIGTASLESEVKTYSEKEMIVPHFHTSDDLAKLLSEVASLKEGNKHMESELKEMQERYSEISLKFAEVEGERQQLALTVFLKVIDTAATNTSSIWSRGCSELFLFLRHFTFLMQSYKGEGIYDGFGSVEQSLNEIWRSSDLDSVSFLKPDPDESLGCLGVENGYESHSQGTFSARCFFENVRIDAERILEILQQDGPGFDAKAALEDSQIRVSGFLVREVLLGILKTINYANKNQCAKLWYKFFVWSGQHYRQTVNSYHLIMKLFADSEEFKAMWRLVDEMIEKGYPTTARTFNILICTCGEAGLARKVVERFVKSKTFNYRPFKHSFNAILHSLLAVNQYRLIEWVYQQMLIEGHSPDILTYNILMCAKYRLGKLDQFHRLLDEIGTNGFSPDFHTFNILLHVLGKGDKPFAALNLLNHMKEVGFDPSVLHFTTLIDGLSRAGNLEACKFFFDEMIKHGCMPDVVCYTVMITAYIVAGELEKAQGMFNEMIIKGQMPNVFTYNSMIRGLCMAGKFEEASMMLKEMESRGCNPNFLLYNTLVSNLRNAGKLSEAHEVIRQMVEKGQYIHLLSKFKVR